MGRDCGPGHGGALALIARQTSPEVAAAVGRRCKGQGRICALIATTLGEVTSHWFRNLDRGKDSALEDPRWQNRGPSPRWYHGPFAHEHEVLMCLRSGLFRPWTGGAAHQVRGDYMERDGQAEPGGPCAHGWWTPFVPQSSYPSPEEIEHRVWCRGQVGYWLLALCSRAVLEGSRLSPAVERFAGPALGDLRRSGATHAHRLIEGMVTRDVWAWDLDTGPHDRGDKERHHGRLREPPPGRISHQGFDFRQTFPGGRWRSLEIPARQYEIDLGALWVIDAARDRGDDWLEGMTPARCIEAGLYRWWLHGQGQHTRLDSRTESPENDHILHDFALGWPGWAGWSSVGAKRVHFDVQQMRPSGTRCVWLDGPGRRDHPNDARVAWEPTELPADLLRQMRGTMTMDDSREAAGLQYVRPEDLAGVYGSLDTREVIDGGSLPRGRFNSHALAVTLEALDAARHQLRFPVPSIGVASARAYPDDDQRDQRIAALVFASAGGRWQGGETGRLISRWAASGSPAGAAWSYVAGLRTLLGEV